MDCKYSHNYYEISVSCTSFYIAFLISVLASFKDSTALPEYNDDVDWEMADVSRMVLPRQCISTGFIWSGKVKGKFPFYFGQGRSGKLAMMAGKIVLLYWKSGK